ncbi:NCS2 family permease [Bacillus siamensis]|uniref:NCS2 family permease n=2 Tax=Bacillus TaxID=1386 RepID=A0AAI8N1F5_9BACI|nr:MULTISPECIES: NCS2 family permease [Bacillus]AME06113.1 permease [Bacillus sp. SDLI1]AUJ78611.1 NCS2 family permease [Bacillus siamensis]MBN7743368.1 NCS2 family permease [Bacillus velezensis]MDL0428539.1 NCS2 family permease [Bacillus amyloliquefaciens]NRF36576.1 NCS2 family permease [Bacillus velezensis]
MNRTFKLKAHETTVQREFLSGLTAFFTVAYIVIVNASILKDAGMSQEASAIATSITCFLGCLMIAFWANSPLVIIPGMGENIFFSYTIVRALGFSWQEGLAIVFISGVLYTIIAFSPLAASLTKSIPLSMKSAITVGIGLFITFIGLQKGGIVTANKQNLIELGDLTSPKTLLTLVSLLITAVLFIRNVKGGLLISIAAGALLAIPFGFTEWDGSSDWSAGLRQYQHLFGAFSFDRFLTLPFWTAVFSLTMILLFQNLGTIQTFEKNERKFTHAYRATGVSNIFAGTFGTSSTVAALESSVGIASGARTGLSSAVVGLLFLCSVFFMPVIKAIPDSAIAPILILIGSLMLQSIRDIHFNDVTEYFPAFLTIVLIPLTYNIADGMAFGFISYPLIKILCGKGKELNVTVCFVACLFLLNYLLFL